MWQFGTLMIIFNSLILAVQVLLSSPLHSEDIAVGNVCFVSVACSISTLLNSNCLCANRTHGLRAGLGQNEPLFLCPLVFENWVFSVNFSYLCTFGCEVTYTDRRRRSLASSCPQDSSKNRT